MKAWFGCTTAKWPEYREYYFAIRDFLKEMKIEIVNDWIEDADKNFRTSNKSKNVKEIYSSVARSINEADIVIIEHTVPNFSTSYQISYALMRKKHTLVLRLKKESEQYPDPYTSSLESPFLTFKEYAKGTHREVIRDFVREASMENGFQRYNIVLNKRQKYYLDWAALKYKKSRSDIVRKLIDYGISNDDIYNDEMNSMGL
jgi:nucleoside 2-deoxyribosyltransferase